MDRTKKMVYCALFAALIAIGAFIKVPVPYVPFTLQFLFTTLAGMLLGKKYGAISVTLYTVIGLLGVPVFAEGGGIWYILKPSFGYMPGFILGTYITGLLLEKMKEISYIKVVLSAFAGLLAVYAVGMVYYYIISNYVINTPIALWPLFLYCFLLAVPGDIVLCFVSAALRRKIKRKIEIRSL